MNKLFGTPMRSAETAKSTKNITTEYWAYVEWFSQFRPNPEPDSQLYRVSRLRQSNGQPVASIIPVSDLIQSIHLFPLFGSTIPCEWSSGTSLSNASTFLVNSFTDVGTYLLFNPLLSLSLTYILLILFYDLEKFFHINYKDLSLVRLGYIQLCLIRLD